ncbi:MAG: polysaccharide deacetylase [Clostridiales bacterium 43-6]|nr:MAG: polysaccharide deacetylase [Clostridiales bacterium 43-6]
MSIKLKYFPEGKTKALTMSYDDGCKFDRRLVEIFNTYGIKGSFHLNAGQLGASDWYLSEEEISELFRGHEVSAHSYTHPNFWLNTKMGIVNEMLEDRRKLEKLVGYPVRGMSYPFGIYDDRVQEILPAVGIEYARTVNSTNHFDLPKNYLQWNPTCHHKGELMEKAKSFLEDGGIIRKVFYVWGHSFEFNSDNNWELIEEFCRLVGGKDDVWYATNIEIVDYVNALDNLRVSVDETMIYNPGAIPVWVELDDKMIKILPGETVSQ